MTKSKKLSPLRGAEKRRLSNASHASDHHQDATQLKNGHASPPVQSRTPGEPLRSSDRSQKPDEQSNADWQKKKQSIITRTIWSLVMIGVFFAALFAGHIYMIMIITAIQIISFKEVIAISNVPSRARSLRFTKTLNWYFLGSTMYFLYGESVIYYFKHIVLVDKILLPFATHHRFISFMLYVIGMSLLTRCSSAGHRLRNPRRLRLLRHLSPERSLQVSVYAICLDSHGLVLDRRAGSLCHEQHL